MGTPFNYLLPTGFVEAPDLRFTFDFGCWLVDGISTSSAQSKFSCSVALTWPPIPYKKRQRKHPLILPRLGTELTRVLIFKLEEEKPTLLLHQWKVFAETAVFDSASWMRWVLVVATVQAAETEKRAFLLAHWIIQ
jgi:hypothetical protein